MKKYYLAYGSNLNVEQMKKRCRDSNIVGTTILNDYRLVYKGLEDNYAYLTIEKSKGDFVPLGIYEVSFIDEIFLNYYEGYPNFYYKEYFPVDVNGNKEKAYIYIMNQNYEYHLPSQDYINTCMCGYEDFGFDKKILEDAFNYSLKNKGKILKI